MVTAFCHTLDLTQAVSTFPVVMLTSRSGDKHRQLAMNMGATGYFSKPFQQQELLQPLQ